MTPGLFESEKLDYSWPNAEIRYSAGWLGKRADDLQTQMLGLPWQSGQITVYGKSHLIPRLYLWYGDTPYTYSGKLHEPCAMPKFLLNIKDRLQDELQVAFNSVLCNLYRDGNDCVGWHSDNEKELGKNPVIASISLGATRKFRLRHTSGHVQTREFELSHGDLLVMKGECQKYWQHCVPRQRGIRQPRINLTFRLNYF